MSRPYFVAAAIVLSAAGCQSSVERAVPTVRAEPATFEIGIEARGELRSAQSTKIQVPGTLRGRQRVSWLAEDGEAVQSDQVVAKLDQEQVLRSIKSVKDELARIDYKLRAKRRALEAERKGLESQIALLERERDDAQRFAPRDENLFSRQEIIDAQIDLDLIDTKIKHTHGQLARYTERAHAEIEILQLQRKTEGVKLAQYEESLRSLEIRAPHEGVFLVSENWRGEKSRVGLSVWRGYELGELPDLTQMEAKVYVLESEAAGLAEGLPAAVTVDAHPEHTFEGSVKSVQPIANPIDRESPVKYFEVIVELEDTDTELMRPASAARARILVSKQDGVFAVPNQAVFQDNGETWVWVRSGGGFTKQKIELGERSVSRTVVTSGLTKGQVIALVDPEAGDSAEPA